MTASPNNLFTGIPLNLPSELETLLASGRQFRLKRIVSRGHTSAPGDWYDQQEDEWVILLSGAARLEFEDEDELLGMNPGDHLLIPAHRRHRVQWTAPGTDTVWLALYFFP